MKNQSFRARFQAVVTKTSPSLGKLSNEDLNETVQNCLEICDGQFLEAHIKFDIDLLSEETNERLLAEFERVYASWVGSHQEDMDY